MMTHSGETYHETTQAERKRCGRSRCNRQRVELSLKPGDRISWTGSMGADYVGTVIAASLTRDRIWWGNNPRGLLSIDNVFAQVDGESGSRVLGAGIPITRI